MNTTASAPITRCGCGRCCSWSCGTARWSRRRSSGPLARSSPVKRELYGDTTPSNDPTAPRSCLPDDTFRFGRNWQGYVASHVDPERPVCVRTRVGLTVDFAGSPHRPSAEASSTPRNRRRLPRPVGHFRADRRCLPTSRGRRDPSLSGRPRAGPAGAARSAHLLRDCRPDRRRNRRNTGDRTPAVARQPPLHRLSP